jgi:hypothetical protein
MNLRPSCSVLLACLAAGSAVSAEPEPVRLVTQPALGADLAAFPRIAGPDEPGLQRINRALADADVRVGQAAKECRADAIAAQADPKDAGWQRGVSVAMRGAGYLALVASDHWFCGGAYPDTDQFALAYDLRTGAPLNWERLLPKALSGTASLDTAGDGTRLGVVASAELTALYLKLVKPDAECTPALRDTELHFMLWPDAERDGIAIAPSGLPHVIAACGMDAVIPETTLRTLGVAAGLVDAIASGHKAGLFGPTP